MTKGTTSFGKKIGVKHIRCRRCGRTSYNVSKKYCSACGYRNPIHNPAKIRSYNWQTKNYRRIRIR
jgi:large subunit ribosomal protein L37e